MPVVFFFVFKEKLKIIFLTENVAGEQNERIESSPSRPDNLF